MFYAKVTREQMLAHLPQGGTWCEVGVFSGAFSRKIIDIVAPQKLHLVDVWKWTYYDWDNPPATERGNIEAFKAWAKHLFPTYDGGHPDKLLLQFYQDLSLLAKEEKRTNVGLHRGASVDMAKTFSDAYFDVIYIDADHHYDAVLADLFAYSSKLKPGGLLFGDDFLEDLSRRDGLYGTIDAVNTFTKRTGFKCLLITGFGEAQYVLYREMEGYADHLLSNLLNAGQIVVELNDVLLSRFVQKTVRTSSAESNVPSFV